MNISKKVYFLIKFILIVITVFSLFRVLLFKDYSMVIVSLLTLIVYALPNIVGKIFKVQFPFLLDIAICVFTFLSTILGDVYNFYVIVPWWDDVLHFTSGMMFVEIGLFFIDLIKKKNNKIYLNSLYKIAISFCFTITVLSFWECIEFGFDNILGTDTQKDTVITEINSSEFTRKNKKLDKKIYVDSIFVNDQDWKEIYGGYLDIGLYDTMIDLLDGILGALIYSCIRYRYLRKE